MPESVSPLRPLLVGRVIDFKSAVRKNGLCVWIRVDNLCLHIPEIVKITKEMLSDSCAAATK